MDNTVKETWIDKLVDELVDAKNEVVKAKLTADETETLVVMLFNNALLSYNGNGLRLENDAAIFEYLKAIRPDTYNYCLNKLQTEREEERKRLEVLKAANDKNKAKEA